MGSSLLPRISKRIVLRRLGISDLEDFQSYRCDPEVARYQDWEVMSDNEARSFLAAVNRDTLLRPGYWSQIGIAHRRDDRLIGDIGLCVAAQLGQAEIGFSLARHAQGKGLAREAVQEAMRLVFEHSDVNQIIGITDARNLPSIKLMESVGMEKFDEQDTVFKDEPCTEHFFVLSRDEKVRLDDLAPS